MTLLGDSALTVLVGGVLALLVVASVAGWILDRRVTSPSGRATVDDINTRIRAWWVMIAISGGVLLAGNAAIVTLFGLCRSSRSVSLLPRRRSGGPITRHCLSASFWRCRYSICWSGCSGTAYLRSSFRSTHF